MALEPAHVSYNSRLYKSAIALHFLLLDCKTHSPRISKWLDGYYTSCDQRAAFPSHATSYYVEIEELDSPVALKFEQERNGIFTKFRIANAHCYFEDGIFYSNETGQFAHQIEIDVINRTLRANIGGEFIESEESFIYNVMRDLLGKLLLPVNRLMMMHGAVVTDGTNTIFLAGDKGMGKSTIALKLVESGYKILSDDSPLFTYIDGKTLALSSLDELSVTENTLKLFPHFVDSVSRQREISGKYFVSRAALGPTKLATGPYPITHFIQLNRGACDQPALAETNKTQVTGELLREFMSIFNQRIVLSADPQFFKNVTHFIFDTTSSLLVDARSYRLDYDNRDLERIPELIESTAAIQR